MSDYVSSESLDQRSLTVNHVRAAALSDSLLRARQRAKSFKCIASFNFHTKTSKFLLFTFYDWDIKELRK